MPLVHRRRWLLALVMVLTFPVAVWAALPVGAADPAQDVEEIARWIRERQDGAAPAPLPPCAWPAPGHAEVTSPFGYRLHPVLKRFRLHAGLDIGAPEGAAAAACWDGVVIAVAELPAYGRVVVLDHGGGLATVYAHLSAVRVSEGDRVPQGDEVGWVGVTGQVTGPHLHFEVWLDGRPVDPLRFADMAGLSY